MPSLSQQWELASFKQRRLLVPLPRQLKVGAKNTLSECTTKAHSHIRGKEIKQTTLLRPRSFRESRQGFTADDIKMTTSGFSVFVASSQRIVEISTGPSANARARCNALLTDCMCKPADGEKRQPFISTQTTQGA